LKRATSLAMGGLLALALLTWSATVNLPDGRLHVAFLGVGQGDAIFITTPNGRQILIDGGPSTAQLGRRLGQEMPFWDRSIDLIINTHPDQDHLGGLVEILERYEVEAVFISDAVSSSPLHQAWITQLEGDNQQPVLAWQGMALALDEGVQALILNPGPASRYAESPNDHSVVIKLSMGESSFLLPGDIEAGVERALAASGFNLQATVLKSPHHGSKTSSDPHFLDEVNPQLVVISAGADNPFGHPHEAILQRYIGRGITTLRTDELGTIEFITNGRQVWVETRP
jgi:competence protein ComEC